MKKLFSAPLILTTDTILGNGDGNGSNQAGDEYDKIRPVPMSFAEWTQSRFVSDYDQNPGVDFQDYAAWWSQCGFGETDMMQLNPGVAVDVLENK